MASDAGSVAAQMQAFQPPVNGSATESTPLLPPPEIDLGKLDDTIKATMFWEEMRTIPRFALPLFGSQVLEFSMVFVSLISIGHLSTTSLAGVSLGTMTANVTGLSVLQGLASALDTLLPSAFTSSQPQLVGLWAQCMGVVMAFAVVPIAFIWFSAEPILLALKQDPQVARWAALYLRWFSFGLPPYAFNCISRRYFQSQGLFYIQTRIISCVAPANVMLNYLLVWGPEPIRLGYIGAPIASALSFYLISTMSFIHIMYLTPRTTWHPLSTRMFTNLGVIVRLGLSGIAALASEWWAWEFIALAASFMGPVVLAAQSILLTTGAMAFQLSYAIASATSIRIGNLLGEKDALRAGVAAQTSLVISLITAVSISTTLALVRDSWAYLFNSDPEVVTHVAAIIPFIALYQIFDTNAAVAQAILRTRGKQFIGALINVSAYYAIGLPLGFWLAFRCDLKLRGLWMGLTASLIYGATIGTYIAFRVNWVDEVIRVQNRLAEEERLQKSVDVEAAP